MTSKHICPKCGGKEFYTTAVIEQGWLVDEDGDYIAVTEECLDTIATPDDDNIWTCTICGAEAVIDK